MWSIVLFYVLLLSTIVNGSPRTDVTVSGGSAGSAMATQLHIAFSNDISGSGLLAGPPYYCAQGSMLKVVTDCVFGFGSVNEIHKKMKSYASDGKIDKLENLLGDPVYIFRGKNDIVVTERLAKDNEEVYKPFNPNLKTNYDTNVNHGIPTENYGGKCETLNSENFLNNCNFSVAYEMLNHLYGGNLIKPTVTTRLNGKLIEFDQGAFMNRQQLDATEERRIVDTWSQWIDTTLQLMNPVNYMPVSVLPSNGNYAAKAYSISFDKTAYMYVPSRCSKGKGCSIHVALHGCRQGKERVGETVALHAGYNEVAELNNIIVIYPQVKKSLVFPINPQGCFDWWSYTNNNYANKLGPQMSAVKNIIDTVRAIHA